jgi:dihydroorotate dehydrogenase (fumarate)
MNTRIADISLDSCIYNASGPRCSTYDELFDLSMSESGAILTKSTTLLPRNGNEGKRYYDNEIMSINSTGLANKGYKYYGDIVRRWSKPYIISVAGLTLGDNVKIITDLQENPPDAIELNLSCPNIVGKSQVAYDYNTMETYLRKIFDVAEVPIGLKLPAYFDQQQFMDAAELIESFPVKFVTCINSLGYGLLVDINTETTMIVPNRGHGGIGGKAVLPIALANVRQFRILLPEKIDVIGCGGIVTGEDVFSHILVGAKAVQVGTQFMKEGTGVFKRLTTELKGIMDKKGYKEIGEFYGKLV